MRRATLSPTAAGNEIKLFGLKNQGGRAAELKNPYADNKNAHYGDMPLVWAFEVENNMRKAIQDILRPIVSQNEKSAT